MGDTANTGKAPKKSLIKGLKSEFGKIVWPDRETVGKQTVVVIVISAILALVIAVLDLIIKGGLSFII
ncbi:MAG: preprotein translocase subunit SecE [Clostridiales bacterium]|nr:preprotein translocase subunit SecE [Clostridiales bacterium]MCD8223336.1 preprotein translocase subunit SecE [Clostridiales bacterium]